MAGTVKVRDGRLAGMKVSLRLQRLAAADLEEILKRRPDCVGQLLAGELGWERLASALVAPPSLAKAVNSLNVFLRQVVELTVFHDGTLSAANAATEGLGAALFARARLELARWGLAFPGEDGEIELVPGVSHLIWDPGGLGPGAEFMLEAQTVDVLRPMAMNMGLTGTALPSRKTEMISAILQRMGDPVAVAGLLAKAPSLARSSFEKMRKSGGRADSGWHLGQGGSDLWHWHPDRATDGAWWLVGHGLALPREPGSWRLVVPAEVELAVRGRIFPTWDPDQPAVPTTPLAEGKHPLELVALLSAMLQEFRAAPAPALQQGGLPKRVVKRLAASLRQEEAVVQELAVAALDAGLLAEVEVVPEQRSRSRRNPRVLQSRKAEIRASADAAQWERLSEPERWVDFSRRILIAGTDPSVPTPERVPEARMLDFLLRLPPGEGGSAQDLATALHWTYPATFASVTSARRQLLMMGSALAWLGAGGGEPAIGLSAAGRLLAGPPELDPRELELAFPSSVDTCTLTADRRIVVSGPPSPDLSQFLGRIADVESVQPARIYSLSEASVGRGLDGGLSRQEIVEFFSRHCPGGIPQNVAALVEDVAGRHGRLRVGSAGVYVMSDDPAEIAALVKGRSLRPLTVRQVAPTVAVIDAKGVDQVLSLLRKSGLMPVVDHDPAQGEGQPASQPISAVDSSRKSRKGSTVRSGSVVPRPGELARTITLGPKVDVRQAQDHKELPAAAVVSRALESRRSITVGYQSLGGRAVRLLRLTPFSASGGILQGYEHGMRQVLKLDLQRVKWADDGDGSLLVQGLNSGWSEDPWGLDYDEGDWDEAAEDDWDEDSDFEVLLMPPGRGD